jgi:phage terminase large subunit-like protein
MSIYEVKSGQKIQQDTEMVVALKRQHTKQLEFRSSNAKIRAFIGGNRTGKTVCGAQEVVRYAFGIHESRLVESPCEIWCACPSYDQQLETTQKKLQAMIPKYRIKDVTFIKKNVWGRIELDNGTIISFKSYEQGADKFQGTGKRLIWFDEEPPRDIWEESFVRVEAGIPLDIILTMTPVNGLTWTYDEIFLATHNPDIKVVTATWEDNPWLTNEQKQQMARGLTEDALSVRKEGRYIQRTGLVCNWFDRSIHVVPDLRRLPQWNVYRVIDFGWSSSKTCVVWYGVDSFDRVFVFDGLYINETNDEDLATMIKEREWNYRVIRGWADNQPDRINTLRRNGVMSQPISKQGGREGWDTFRTQCMAKIGAIDPTTRKSKLYISSALTEYDSDRNIEYHYPTREMESLRWKDRRTGGDIQSTAMWNDAKCPIKNAHYDFIDNFSYFCAEFVKMGGGHVPLDAERIGSSASKQHIQKKKVVNRLTGF